MKRSHLRVIDGGLVSKEAAKKEFVEAFVTDTRLMGQVGMGIHWKVVNHPDATDLFQFFSFNAEEEGLDNYKSVWGTDRDAIALIRQTMIGPLGGEDIMISERQARALFTCYYKMSRTREPVFSLGMQEYRFLIDEPVELPGDEAAHLFDIMCTPIESDYQLINYFLMRVFAKDLPATDYLSQKGVPANLFPDIPDSMLIRNSIEKEGDMYINHSLLEHNGTYHLAVTTITCSEGKIASFHRGSVMPVSFKEAALMTSSPEFVTVYTIMGSEADFESNPLEFRYNTMITEHEGGRLFMTFNSNNNHVGKKIYKLSDDVFGVYYITNAGEFIVAANNKENIIALEKDLLHCPVGPYIIPVGKYEFQEPVLLQFVDSDFMYFKDFIEVISLED